MNHEEKTEEGTGIDFLGYTPNGFIDDVINDWQGVDIAVSSFKEEEDESEKEYALNSLKRKKLKYDEYLLKLQENVPNIFEIDQKKRIADNVKKYDELVDRYNSAIDSENMNFDELIIIYNKVLELLGK